MSCAWIPLKVNEMMPPRREVWRALHRDALAEAVRQRAEGVAGEHLLVVVDRVDADGLEVVDCGAEPGGLDDRHRAGFELPGNFVRCVAVLADVEDHLAAAEERRHRLEQLGSGPEPTDTARPEHLVASEADEVGVPVRDIDRAMGDGLGGVDERERTGRVCRLDEGRDVVDSAQHVRHRGEREQLGAVEELVEVGHVEAVVVSERDPAHVDAALGREDVPGHDVRVMLHLGEQHGVALLEVRPPPRVREEVDRLGDVLREHDLVRGRGADEASDLCARRLVHRSRFLRDGVHAPVDVRVVGAVVVVHRVEHRGGLLRRRRGVEVDESLAVDLTFEDREVGADARRRRGPSQLTCAAVLNESNPSVSMRRASSGPPVATIRPSRRTCTTSGVRCSRIRW